MNKLMAKFILMLFHARTNAHLLHLATKSYSQHKALEELYEGLTELTDKIAEVFQGQYGQFGMADYPTSGAVKFVDAPLDLIHGLAGWIADHRAQVCGKTDTHLQNLIDELVALLRQTQYKLENLL